MTLSNLITITSFHITTKQVPQTQPQLWPCGHADTPFLALVFSCHCQDLLVMKSDVVIASDDHQLCRNWMPEHFPKPPDIICPGLQEKKQKKLVLFHSTKGFAVGLHGEVLVLGGLHVCLLWEPPLCPTESMAASSTMDLIVPME